MTVCASAVQGACDLVVASAPATCPPVALLICLVIRCVFRIAPRRREPMPFWQTRNFRHARTVSALPKYVRGSLSFSSWAARGCARTRTRGHRQWPRPVRAATTREPRLLHPQPKAGRLAPYSGPRNNIATTFTVCDPQIYWARCCAVASSLRIVVSNERGG